MVTRAENHDKMAGFVEKRLLGPKWPDFWPDFHLMRFFALLAEICRFLLFFADFPALDC